MMTRTIRTIAILAVAVMLSALGGQAASIDPAKP